MNTKFHIIMLSIHEDIHKKLAYFHDAKKVPNILFHGPCGSGKRTIVDTFVKRIYNDDKERVKNYVMNVNCAYGKGIKFIRDELKFFAKTNIHCNNGDVFKTIILMNADKLTMDAQSALRRCIELYNHSTRFFIIVEDKYKLLRPILSRFCEVYVCQPLIEGEVVNLYQYNIKKAFQLKSYDAPRSEWLKKELSAGKDSVVDVIQQSLKIYDKGYSAINVLDIATKYPTLLHTDQPEEGKYELMLLFNKLKKDMKSEKLLIYYLLHYIHFAQCIDLEEHILL